MSGSGQRVAVVRLVMAVLLVSVSVGEVRAQSIAPSVDVDPPSYPFRLGPVLLSPSFKLRQFGLDTNIFVDDDNPREDFVATFTPDVNVFLRPRLMRLTGYFAADFNYFQTYSNERYIAPTIRGRADFLLSRFRPFLGAGRTDTRDRPNREIDVRARRTDNEFGGGLAFELSPASFVYASSTQTQTNYESGQRMDGVDLETALDKDTTSYDGGIRLSLTPLTSLSLVAGYSEDDFTFSPERNANSGYGYAEFAFASDAIFRGTARFGFRNFQPETAALEAYQGLTAQVAIVYPFMDRGSFTVSVLRDVTYSFEEVEGYYVETTGDLTYTHRIAGGWDLQVRGASTRMTYADQPQAGDRVDHLRILGGGVGYNFIDQSRLGLSYEWWGRSSDDRPDRDYDRHRFFASWAYTF
jgi:hypothetical protein